METVDSIRDDLLEIQSKLVYHMRFIDPVFKLQTREVCTRTNIADVKGGIELLVGLFRTFCDENKTFQVTISATPNSANGWGIEKHEKGFLFYCNAEGSFNNFPHADMWAYRTKEGTEYSLYGILETDKVFLDSNCFLDIKGIDGLLSDLKKGNLPSYSSEHWTSFTL